MKNIPELRFPEFDGEWVVRRLGEVGEFKNGINKSKEDFGFGVPFINLMDVFGKPTISRLNLGLVNASENEVKTYTLNKGDVLFIRSSVKKEGVGETSLVLQDMKNTVYSGFIIRFRDTKIKLELMFKKYCFAVRTFRKDLISLSTTSANTNINQEALNGLYLKYPNKEEQTKIANFLTTVDKKITQLKQKKVLLEQYKKGVMQKIFSQEIRFKDENGKGFPAWEEKRLGELSIKIGSGSTPTGGEKVYQNFGIPFIRSQNVTDNQLNLDEVCISEKINNKMNNSIVKANDILLNITGASIGRSCVVPNNFDKGNVNQHVCIIRLNKNNNHYFVQFFLSSYEGKKLIYQNQTGSGREGLNFQSIKSFKLSIPTLPEQAQIANFLTKLDEKINRVDSQIKKSELWKKGLLQRMFCLS